MHGLMEVAVHAFDTWPEFKAYAFDWIFVTNGIRRGEYVFRGQASSDWSLVASFDREFFSFENWQDIENQLLNDFRLSCEDIPDLETLHTFPGRDIALAQHYGLPTRLLDWTVSPYTAAFFAFEHALANLMSGQKTVDDKVAVWIASVTSPAFEENQPVRFIEFPAWKNLRLHRQTGVFTLNNSAYQSIDEYVRNTSGEDAPLAVATLPISEARSALLDLELMGINADNLYGDLGGKAKAAKTRVLLDLFSKLY